jgi:hypothetical protein
VAAPGPPSQQGGNGEIPWLIYKRSSNIAIQLLQLQMLLEWPSGGQPTNKSSSNGTDIAVLATKLWGYQGFKGNSPKQRRIVCQLTFPIPTQIPNIDYNILGTDVDAGPWT